MKITDLKIHVLKSPLAEPFAFSQGWVKPIVKYFSVALGQRDKPGR